MKTKQDLQKEIQRLKYLVVIDPLTKVYNKRKYREDIKRLLYNYKRYNHSFVLIYIDMDNFKQINDTYGHLKGDCILRNTVKQIQNKLRYSDKVYRIGGDEFALILRTCTVYNAEKTIKKILKNISLKFSYGISFACKQCEQIADKRLYRMKGDK